MNALTVNPEDAGMRLDAWLARRRPEHSRARWQALIRSGCVTLNDRPAMQPDQRVSAGDMVQARIPPPTPTTLTAEPIPLNVLFEDQDIIVLNKPPGLVVHPAAGHASGTLVNALLAHCPNLAGVGGEQRPGIVHRLDRNTSGVMVVAKNETAMRALAAAFKYRAVKKEYVALVWGIPTPPAGRLETLIGRHPRHRQKMSVRPTAGRTAVTTYETVESFGEIALLRVRIETGRTHQIRVHMAHLGHPVVGDTQYGRPRRTDISPISRQMLHAARLAFPHPCTGVPVVCEAPLPTDMQSLIEALRRPHGQPPLAGQRIPLLLNSVRRLE